MRFRLILIFFQVVFLSHSGICQAFYRILDKSSGETLKEYDCEVIQDGYINYSTLKSNGSDYYSIAPPYSDLQASGKHRYFLSIEKRDYLPQWIEIDLERKDTLEVFLDKDPNFREEEKGLYFNWCGIPIMRSYYPKPFRRWEDLPENVAEQIKKQVIARIGPAAFQKLYISTAHQFDTDLMNRLGVKNSYPPGTKSYRVCLSFSDPEKGIAQYTSELVYLDNGTMVVPPKFPIFAFHKGERVANWDLKPVQEITKSAQENFDDLDTSSQPIFEYYPRRDTFAWVFSKQMEKKENGLIRSRTMYLDAFTGELLAVFYDETLSLH